jgi:hypothetical protein
MRQILKRVFGSVFSGTADLFSRNCGLRFAEKIDAVVGLEGSTNLAAAEGLAIAQRVGATVEARECSGPRLNST